jgi:hypothetical protein
VESFGSEFFDNGFDFRAILHFANEAQPPGVGPGDEGLVRAVVALGFAPLEETEVVSEAETEFSCLHLLLEELAEMTGAFVESCPESWFVRFGGRDWSGFLCCFSHNYVV